MSSTVLEALALAVRAGVPVLLWGSPGTGKTSAVVGLGRALGWPVEVVIGAIREPSDFAGLPVVDRDGVRFAPPEWARRLAASPSAILFLDELTTSTPAVQAAMLRVVLERHVGDLALPASVRIVAAANPPEEAADGWDLTAPMANRLVHLQWEPTAQAVADGFVLGFPAPPTEAVPQARPEHERAARAVIAAFLRVRPTLVLAVPAGASAAGRAWPSPRSWEAVARLWAEADASGASAEVRAVLVRGAVGDGPAAEFLSWVTHLDLPDPGRVLADPEAFVLPERGDRAYAALAAIAGWAVAADDPVVWAAAWVVVAKAAQTAPDVAVLVATLLAAARPAGAELPSQVAALTPVLRAAGLSA